MFKNIYRTDPVHLVVWSRDDKSWINTRLVLFGQQPAEIKKSLTAALAAFNRGGASADNAALKRYFGPGWRDAVGLSKRGGDPVDGDANYGADTNLTDISADQSPHHSITEPEPDEDAGDSDTSKFIVDADDNDTAVLDNSADIVEEITVRDIGYLSEEQPKVKISKATVQFIFDVDVYPEDKVSEFKLKICQMLKIPIFRQHLWYNIAGQNFPMSYNFILSGASQNVDMNSVMTAADVDAVAGIPVNMFLYRNKDAIKIEAYDNFTLLGNIYNRGGVKEFNLIDLETFIGPQRTALAEISKSDKYQLQILFYGFITKYYPMLNLAAFVEYLDDRDIHTSYPQLAPSATDLAFLQPQQELMRELYTLYEGDENRVNRIDQILTKSLTETTLKVVSSVRGKMIKLRILFDLFALDEKVTAIRLYDQIDGKHVLLDKFLAGGRAATEKLIPGVLYFRVIISEQPRQQLNLFLYPNGAYAIKGVWGEDQNYEFDDVNLLVDRHINPIIKRINSFASQIMYHGTSVVPEVEKGNVKFIDISISLFWKKILTSGEFKQLKTILDQMVVAHIIQEKQVDRNVVSYFFKRGMFEFDPRRIEKNAVVDNHYAYLFNADIRQKWFMLFENIRVMTVTHRFSDVKIEISGIKEDEYYIFIRYIVLLMSQFMRVRSTSSVADDRITAKPLSNLKEQDPHLYNFKKLYNSELVYSKLCQKPYQPNLLTQAQFDALDKSQKARVTKYWNFTTGTDAYYQCPNPKFPHVRFIVGKHPMGYCIPCCKITAPPANPRDKQRQIYDKCIQEHTFEKRDVERSTSRYIMSYGKSIDIGRLSNLPETSLEPLFYETKMESTDEIGAKYYLYGVPQNHPNAKLCGLIYCYSHAMGMNIDVFIKLAIEKIEKNSNNFQMLLNGRILEWFKTPKELISAMHATFLGSTVSEFPYWNEIIQDIALHLLEIYTVTFEDRDTVIQLQLPEYLDNIEDIKYPNHTHIITLHNLSTNHWNPIYVVHKDLYFRAGIIDRKLFNFQSDVVQLIMDMIQAKYKDLVTNRFTYDVVRRFVDATPHYDIETILVTRDNLCYGVIIDTVGYVPVYLSHFKWSADQQVSFKSATIVPANPARLREFISRYNNWVAKLSEAGGFIKVDVPVSRPLLERVEPIYPIVQPERWLVGEKGAVFAWQSNNLNFYITQITQAAAKKLSAVPFLQMTYNPIQINKTLEGALDAAPDRRTNRIDYALYNKHLYQLLVLEFIQMFNHHRNYKVREQIKRAIMRTDFKQPWDGLIAAIETTILQGFDQNTSLSNDVEKIKLQIREWILTGAAKKELFKILDADYYGFDMVLVERLKRMPHRQIYEQLHKLARSFVKIGAVDKKSFKFPNILMSCQGAKTDYCSRGALIISQEDLDRYIEVLTAQIKNPFIEKYLFNPLFQSNMIDYFVFTRREGEIIEIEFL